MDLFKKLNTYINEHLFLTALIARVALIMYSEFHDRYFRVKFTDIDYMIVVDGAQAIVKDGECPFKRTTYRYTPLLAILMVPSVVWFNAFGKVFFCLCDVCVLYLSDQLLKRRVTKESRICMLKIFIALNPIVLNVSTRGNSDILVTLISFVAFSFYEHHRYYLASAMLGFGMHFKIYPIIYVAAFVFGLWDRLGCDLGLNRAGRSGSTPTAGRQLVLMARITAISGLCFITCFAIPTFVSYLFCGDAYIQEAFIYHMRREDHRHNFSPYWLLMYLNMAARAARAERLFNRGFWAFIPQAVVLLFASWRLRRNVVQACCTVTILFIAFNKVCTVQYFVWFIPLLPFVFCTPLPAVVQHQTTNGTLTLGNSSDGKKKIPQGPSIFTILVSFVVWGSSIVLWVFTTYSLEFQGKNHYGRVWLMSCVFFLSTVAFGGWVGRLSYFTQTAQVAAAKDKAL